MSTPLHSILAALERWVPSGSALSFDNVGLQVGDPSQPVTRALVALDCTAEVIVEAEALGAELIVTHHPLIFQKLKRVAAGAGPPGLAYQLARRGLALVAAHTNLDVATGGVSFALAERLGVQEVQVLQPTAEARYVLTTFVPAEHASAVRNAMADAGAGRIGAYDECSFSTSGTGTFRPGDDARPFTGTPAGTLEETSEWRLEMEVPRWHLDRVVTALRAAHPYEEPAYHVVPALQPDTRTGLGAVGDLPEAMAREAFLEHVCAVLDTPAVRTTGGPDLIRRVAVCGGSGSSLVGEARAARADAYVTADVTYHKFFDVLDADGRARLLYVDAGHFETERHTEAMLCDTLAAHFPEVTWNRTRHRTTASEVYVRGAR